MGSFPPQHPPPPYGLDPREQRRLLKAQARAQRDSYRAQRDVYRAQQAMYRQQARGFRRRSFLGPILLILIGVDLLLIREGKVSPLQAFELYNRWWPMLFVVAGAVVLLEWGFDQFMGSMNPDAPPVARRALGGGAILLLILLSIGGLASIGIRRHAQQMFADMGGDSDSMAKFLGEKHESDQALDQVLTAGSTLSINNPHGDVTITGGSPDGRIHVASHQEVYSTSDSEATRKTQQLTPQISSFGNQMTLNVPTVDSTNADLTITVPEATPLSINANHGDVRVTGIQAMVSVTANHGDIELSTLGSDANIRVNRRDSSVSAHNIAGSVMLKGHAQDLNVSDIGGQVSLDGDFYGTSHLEQVRGALHFKTSRTDLQIARLDGEVEVSPDASLSIDRAAGPTTLATRDRNITMDRISGDISVTNTNGTVDVTSAPPLGDVIITNRRGSVNVTLPDHLGFSVDAQATDGSVQNEFGLAPSDSGHRSSLTSTVGRGGPKVKIITTHGDVDLRKAIINPLAPPPPAPPAPPAIHLWGKPMPPANSKDGTIVQKNGKDFVIQDKDGSSVIHKDGKTILHSKDGNTLEIKDK